jgi:hypothetical protein
MPLLRIQINSFIRTWNIHAIRKQKNRPHLVPGKPYILYNFPPHGVRNHGLCFDKDLFQTLQSDVQEWGKYNFLYFLGIC